MMDRVSLSELMQAKREIVLDAGKCRTSGIERYGVQKPFLLCSKFNSHDCSTARNAGQPARDGNV
jgi:hypothetical protein